MIRSLLVLSLFAICIDGVSAQTKTAAEVPTMAALSGTCDRLVIGGQDISGQCSGKLLNTIYRTGRVGFYFVTSDGAALTFTGLGTRQVDPDPDTAVHPVDGVIFGFKGQYDRTKAVGTCRFTSPHKRPGTVICNAETQGGTFEATFTTDGNPPAKMNP